MLPRGLGMPMGDAADGWAVGLQGRAMAQGHVVACLAMRVTCSLCLSCSHDDSLHMTGGLCPHRRGFAAVDTLKTALGEEHSILTQARAAAAGCRYAVLLLLNCLQDQYVAALHCRFSSLVYFSSCATLLLTPVEPVYVQAIFLIVCKVFSPIQGVFSCPPSACGIAWQKAPLAIRHSACKPFNMTSPLNAGCVAQIQVQSRSTSITATAAGQALHLLRLPLSKL